MSEYKNFTKIILISMILSSSAVSLAAHDKFAIGANIGLNGYGLEGRAPIIDKLYGRLGANYFNYKYKNGESNVNYKLDLSLLTVPLMLDFHPFEGSSFRLSAGIAYNGNEIKGAATPAQNITLYGRTYTPKQVGSLSMSLKYKNKVAPVFSIGYDNSLRSSSPITFNFEAGVMYSGEAKISSSATGLIRGQTQFLNDINRNANDNLNSVKKYLKFFPVVSLGLKYSF